MSDPRVSILLSVYNGEEYLESCLNSLSLQTERRFECWLMDDGSTDGTTSVLKKFSSTDPRFRVLRHEKNIGLTRSLIELSERARAPFLARMDADDLADQSRLQMQADFLEKNLRVGAVGCAFNVIDEEGEFLSLSTPAVRSSALKAQLRRRNPLAHGSLLLRRNAFVEAGGYREAFRMAQDYDLLLRISTRWDVAALPEALYSLRLTKKGLGISKQKQQKFFADLALHCHELRSKQQDDSGFIQEATQKIPPASEGGPSAESRYAYLKALHLAKAGRTREALDLLSSQDGRDIYPLNSLALKTYCRIPRWGRRILAVGKKSWESSGFFV